MSAEWEEAIARTQKRRDAMEALPDEVKELLQSIRKRWQYTGHTKHYECVRAECLRIWGKINAAE